MKRIALAFAASLTALPMFARAAEPLAAPAAPTKSPVEIQTITVSEVKGDHAVLNVRWKYIEQENLPRPRELAIIAVLQGLHGETFTAKKTVPVPASGPIPVSAAVPLDGFTIALGATPDGFIAFEPPATVGVLPKIPGISDGTSNILDGTSNTLTAKKTVTLRLAP
jgi:hypothetical protein